MTDPVITTATSDDGLIDRIMVSYDADGDGIADKVVIDIPVDGGEHMISHSAGTVPVPVKVLSSKGDFVTGLVSERGLDTTGDGVVDQVAVHDHVDHGDGARSETVTYYYAAVDDNGYAAVDDNGSFVITGAALRTETRQWTEDGASDDAMDDRLVSTLFHDPATGRNTFVTREEGQTLGLQKTVTLKSYDGEDETGALTHATVHTYAADGITIIKTAIYTYGVSGDVTQIVTHTYDDQGGLTKTELSGAGSGARQPLSFSTGTGMVTAARTSRLRSRMTMSCKAM